MKVIQVISQKVGYLKPKKENTSYFIEPLNYLLCYCRIISMLFIQIIEKSYSRVDWIILLLKYNPSSLLHCMCSIIIRLNWIWIKQTKLLLKVHVFYLFRCVRCLLPSIFMFSTLQVRLCVHGRCYSSQTSGTEDGVLIYTGSLGKAVLGNSLPVHSHLANCSKPLLY